MSQRRRNSSQEHVKESVSAAPGSASMQGKTEMSNSTQEATMFEAMKVGPCMDCTICIPLKPIGC
jgi:hypothetical protein